MQDIVSVIQSLGFPIACVVAMFAMWQSEVKSHKEEMEQMRQTLEEQTVATTQAITNNTVVLTKILTKLGVDE